MSEPKAIVKRPGTIYRGHIASGGINSEGLVAVKILDQPETRFAKYYPGYFASGKNFTHFIGGAPQAGTPVTLASGDGKEFFIVSLLANVSKIPEIETDSFLIQSDDDNKISLNPSSGTYLGNRLQRIHFNAKKALYVNNFDTKVSISEASISVDGIVKRDRKQLRGIDRRSKLEFDTNLSLICLDPYSPAQSQTITGSENNTARNLPLVEKREMVYEFAYSGGFTNDQEESRSYTSKKEDKTYPTYDRREARTDTLSLSLVAPNFLMETIKGTVVDIYGNILDINRNILPAGKDDSLSFKKNNDKSDAFKKLRNAERKSVAFHFEINARKAPVTNGAALEPDILSIANFSRPRSRLFVDIDKEGQIKMNVPASSETGNISLLTRYENASTIDAKNNNTDPNEFSFNDQQSENRDQRRDIFLDSFAFGGGTIEIVDPINSTGMYAPQDRITGGKIGHGTAYHDVTNILSAHRSLIAFEYAPVATTLNNLTYPITYVNKQITISGEKANAGGRSGSFNFDGSLDLNVGANSSDKQSVVLDTQGGIVGNVGRDFNNVSMGLSMTGDLLIQVGGADSGGTPLSTNQSSDPRFSGTNVAWRPGVVDIRVYRDASGGGEFTVVRIDNNGVSIATPGNMSIVAGKSLNIKAGGQLNFEGESITFWGQDDTSTREVQRKNQSIV